MVEPGTFVGLRNLRAKTLFVGKAVGLFWGFVFYFQ